jgi:Na+-transporting NADH:ubiquinone oxidoreductase subunit NqrC
MKMTNKKNIFKLASEQANGMAKEKIKQILLMAHILGKHVDEVEIEPWMFEHITTAHDDLQEVTSYMRQKTAK